MTEKTEHEKKWKEHIPEESREHYKKAREEFRKSVEGFLPAGVLEHHRNARREMLLAWRSLLDHAIKKMDERS